MSETMVLYSSRYGAARQYAHIAAEELGLGVRDVKDVRSAASGDIMKADRIILCGGIYAGGLSGVSWLRKNSAALAGKKVVLFAVGASPWDETAFQAVKKHNMKGSLEKIPVFYGRGAWDQKAMTFVDRTLCNMLQKSVAKKDPSQWEPWMEALMCARGKSCDWTDPAYLTPLLEYLEA